MEKSRITAMSMILMLLILTVYWPVRHHEFLNIDDQVYVTDNTRVRSGLSRDNIEWAFTSLDAGFWHPLTWLSLMVDASLYGPQAGGFHGTNVLLHMGGTLLLFFAWRRLTGADWQSGLMALLFAVHPLNVEPVAWIASRKDVLSGFFWMLTLWTYALYAELPTVRRYLLVWACFMLGLMSKPMLATLPAVLLLLDYWPLARFKATGGRKAWLGPILEKLPLAVCALAVIIVTFVAEHRSGAIAGLETISLPARIANALVSYLTYLAKTLLPLHLAVFYPHPGAGQILIGTGAGLFIILLTLIAIQNRRRFPYLFVGWLWYLVTLVPVIGFIQLGTLARADRYAYIPLVGIFIAAAGGGAELWGKLRLRHSLMLTAAIIILLSLAVTARLQVAHWQSDLTLFRHAVAVTDNNYKAYHGLGLAYHRLGNDEQAIRHMRRSLSLKPDNRAHIDLGVVYMGQQRFKDAEREFTESLKLKPDNAKAHNNLGSALASQGRAAEAIPQFAEALRLDPGYSRARFNLQQATEAVTDVDKKGQ